MILEAGRLQKNSHKLLQYKNTGEYLALGNDNRIFLENLCSLWHFSSQEIRQIIRIGRDLETWDEGHLKTLWGELYPERGGDRNEREMRYRALVLGWEALKNKEKSYRGFSRKIPASPHQELHFKALDDNRTILGNCPVASEKTRCCNLKTLDAMAGCSFDCSYCSIQSFYSRGAILYHKNLGQKLAGLKLDPQRRHHIGTGQSSDSLAWGNKNGLLTELCAFANDNPHITLELKTKSANVPDMLKQEIPPNLLLTWSLNTPVIIACEEHRTASLDSRLKAARQAADAGIPVGFHLHPIVWYEGWQEDYRALARSVKQLFSPEEVLTISMGTLTFIKSVLKKLRERSMYSKILQMPLEETAGKWSYPFKIKEMLFKTVYSEFLEWKKQVFFYLCMEDPGLWKGVLGRTYKDNDEFEQDMLHTYHKKMQLMRGRI